MRTTSSQSACDNVSCEIIRPQSEFKRCSGCLTLNYCSAKCQLFDWREGGHRSSCKSLLELRRSECSTLQMIMYTQLCSLKDDTTELKSKDRAFLRAIVQNDYAKFKGQIITDQVNYLRATPGVRACELTVHFNYLSQSTDPPSGISIGTLADLAATVPVWKDYVSRARRSDGRMRIHVMHVLDGAHGTCWLFPLRSATGDLAREIERLAAEEKGSKLDQEAVRCLVQRNVEEIHLASRN
ncbi:hypothetical protein C8F04DRAFT_427944 [Mycena alexandri]|uniref:MYND-type domain-containing protein n=1 Tax=Mycena alexandri TaxID=1745969 RepID=A0AAD6X9I7_9AGAR|nr:hypothetical protein C8F04DRAFT_427944 [Mycena alexandri]